MKCLALTLTQSVFDFRQENSITYSVGYAGVW